MQLSIELDLSHTCKLEPRKREWAHASSNAKAIPEARIKYSRQIKKEVTPRNRFHADPYSKIPPRSGESLFVSVRGILIFQVHHFPQYIF
jgi:hypothetical protein